MTSLFRGEGFKDVVTTYVLIKSSIRIKKNVLYRSFMDDPFEGDGKFLTATHALVDMIAKRVIRSFQLVHLSVS